jgi:hypothetical protein
MLPHFGSNANFQKTHTKSLSSSRGSVLPRERNRGTHTSFGRARLIRRSFDLTMSFHISVLVTGPSSTSSGNEAWAMGTDALGVCSFASTTQHIRPTEIEVFSSPPLTQIHSINEICKSHDVICVQEALGEDFEFRVGQAHVASLEMKARIRGAVF